MAFAFIQADKPFYFAGDTVQGNIFLNLFENINANQVFVKFKGWESVRWFEERIVPEHERPNIANHLIFQSMFKIRMDSSDSEDHPGQDDSMRFKYVMEGGMLKEIIKHSGQRAIARFQHVLHNFGGSYIPAGQYAFPFSFKTGENYPASYIDKSPQNNRRGRIKYEMQAFIRGFNNRLRVVKCKQQIVIRESTPIKNDQQQMEAHVTSCCCIDQGTTRIQCFFEKNAYTPGEEAKMYCKIDNTEGKTQVMTVDVSLLNEITYTSSSNYKKTFSSNIFKKSFSGLGQGQKGEREQVVTIVNAQFGNNPSDIKPTARGTTLHSVYYLVVEANLAAACTCCSNLPIVRQPILIYPFIPIDYNFKAPPNWHPQIMPMINLQMGLPSLGIKLNANMPSVNVNMNGPNMNVNMNGPSMTMRMNAPSPAVEMTMVAPPPPVIHTNVGVNNVNMTMNTGYNGGVGMSVHGGVGMSANVNTGVGVGISTNVHSPHHHHHHNGVGMNVHTNVGLGGPNVNMRVGF